MASEVSFNINLKVNGQDAVRQVSVNVDELRRALGETRSAADYATASLIGFNQAQDAIRNIDSAINSVAGTLNSLTEESRTFSGAMAAANTMAGKSGDDFVKLKDQVSELSKQIPIARDELANGLYQVISNGVPEDNWIEYLNQSARASVGGIANLEEVVKVTSTVIKNYGLSWQDAGTIQDKIQLTAKNGVTSFEQMAQALPRVTANAATLGVSIDELMATFATLTGVSGNTAEVSTQLAAIFTALVKPSSEATQMAEQMGIKFDAAAIKAAGGMQNFLVQLDADVKRYAASTETLEQEVYGKLFGSAESLRALIPLTGELSDKFSENVGAMQGSAGTIDGAFETMASTGAAKLQVLNNSLGEYRDMLQASIGNVLPYVNFGAQMTTSAASALQLVTAMRSLGVGTKVASAAVATFGPIVQVARAAMTGATVSANTLKLAVRGLMIASGVGVAIAAVTTAIELFSRAAEKASGSSSQMSAQAQAMQASAAMQEASQKRLGEAAGELTGKFQVLQTQWKNLKAEADKTAFIKQNQSAFAELGLHIDDVNSAYNTFVSNAPKVIAALTSIAEAEAYKDMYKDAVKDKATNYTGRVKYVRAKAGDTIKTDTMGMPSAEYAAAGIKLKTAGMTGGLLAKQTYQPLSSADAKKLNAYRYQQANAANSNVRKGYDDKINTAAQNLANALNKASEAKGVLGSAGTAVPAAGGTARPSTAGGATTKKKAPQNSIAWYEQQMQELREKINTSVDEAATKQLQDSYLKLDDQLKGLKVRVGIDQPNKLKEEAKKILSAVPLVPTIQAGQLKNPMPSREIYSKASSMASDVQTDFEIGLIGVDEAQKQIAAINKALEGMGLKPVEIDIDISKKDVKTLKSLASVDLTNMESWEKTFKAISSLSSETAKGFAIAGESCMALGSALQSLSKDSAAAKAGMILAAIGQLCLSFAQALMSCSTWVEWLAFGISGAATLATLVATISGYATGGIVPGTSYSGDKVMARVNSGEMILTTQQQSRLWAIANGASVYGQALATTADAAGGKSSDVKAELQRLQGLALEGQRETMQQMRLRVKGRDLVSATANETRMAAKSGRKSNIRI